MWYLSNPLLRFCPLQLSLAHSGIPVSRGTPVKRLIASCFPGQCGEDVCHPAPTSAEESAVAPPHRVVFAEPEVHSDGNPTGFRWKRI